MQIEIFHCARKNASCVTSCVTVLNPKFDVRMSSGQFAIILSVRLALRGGSFHLRGWKNNGKEKHQKPFDQKILKKV